MLALGAQSSIFLRSKQQGGHRSSIALLLTVTESVLPLLAKNELRPYLLAEQQRAGGLGGGPLQGGKLLAAAGSQPLVH